MAEKKRRATSNDKKRENIVIAYSNELNDFPLSKYSIKQYDLFWTIVGKIRDKGTSTVTISAAELKNIIGYKGPKKRFNAVLDGLTTNLMNTIYRKDKGNGGFIKRVLFEEAKYDAKAETLTLIVNGESLKFFNNLTGNFTLWYQRTLLDLNTVYSKNLFRKLSQFSKTGKYVAKFDDFRYVIDAPINRINDKGEETYTNGMVKYRIIKPSILRLTPYFKNLKCTYFKSGEEHRLESIEFTFDKFSSKDALDKEYDASECISNIRLNPNLTDDEKCEAEDIFLRQKKGTAKKAMQARKKAGLGPLDDIIDPADAKKAEGRKPVQATEAAVPAEEEHEAISKKSKRSSKTSSGEEIKAKDSLAFLKKCSEPTLPQHITVLDGQRIETNWDYFVDHWVAKNFEEAAKDYEMVNLKVKIVEAKPFSKEKKQEFLATYLLGSEWKDQVVAYTPYDPVLRHIWGKLTKADASLLADVYKKWQNTGLDGIHEHLTAAQQHDESLLRSLTTRLSALSDRFYDMDDETLVQLAILMNCEAKRGWNPANDLKNNMSRILTLEMLSIPNDQWQTAEPIM